MSGRLGTASSASFLQALYACMKLRLKILSENKINYWSQPRREQKLLIKLFAKYLPSCLYVTSGPAKREFSSKEKKAGEDEGRQNSEEQNYQHSPLRKPLIRSSASAVMSGKRYVSSASSGLLLLPAYFTWILCLLQHEQQQGIRK